MSVLRLQRPHSANSPGGPIADYTGTVRTVTVALDVALENLVHKGVPATITLPDNSTVRGTVTNVGSVATAASNDNNNDGSSSTTVQEWSLEDTGDGINAGTVVGVPSE